MRPFGQILSYEGTDLFYENTEVAKLVTSTPSKYQGSGLVVMGGDS